MALVRVLELIFETQNPKLGSRGADTRQTPSSAERFVSCKSASLQQCCAAVTVVDLRAEPLFANHSAAPHSVFVPQVIPAQLSFCH